MSVGSVFAWRYQQDRSRRRNSRRALSTNEPRQEIGPVSRIAILQYAVLLAAAVVTLRLYLLQGAECQKWQKIAARQHESSIKVQGARGTVLDANGRTMAVSVRAYALGAHPADVSDKAGAAAALAALTGETKKELLAKLSSQKSFTWLARGLNESAVERLKDRGIPGLAVVPEFRRIYPQGSLAGAMLGRVDRDGQGLAGLEHGFDQLLSAPSMQLAVRRDARGKLLPASFAGDGEPSTIVRNEGGSLVLSIDAPVQEILETELARGQEEAKAKRAFGVLMDAESGEVLAMAQTPGFDPNQIDGVSPSEMKNAVLQDSFEPGSTLKPLVAALALDAKVVGENETIDCEKSGVYAFKSHVVRDVHPSGVLSFGDVLVRSSNICMAKMGQRMGKSRLYEGLRSLAFGETSGLELPGEAKGILRKPSSWAEIDVLTHSFGQGVSVTALQLVRSYAALANGGNLVEPTLLKRTEENPVRRQRVFTEETARVVSNILAGVTEDEHGTGLKAAIPGVSVRGKTGTAQKARLDGRGYDPDRILASFVGYVDASPIGLRRKLVMFIAVDEPGTKIRYGGVLAAPVFRAAMERVLSYLVTLQPGGSLQAAVTDDGGPRKS